jgi:gliding motility-associated-like protein
MAQLSAPGSSAIRHTSYSATSTEADPVFIFCNASGNQKGALVANAPTGYGLSKFTWNKWNNITKSFSILIKEELNVATSSLNNLDEGGYRVAISGTTDTILTGWIHIDKPFSLAELQNRTCDYVALKGKAIADTFYYSNPSTGFNVRLPNGVKFLWSSNPTSSIPFPDLSLNPQTFNPPLVDVKYNLQVTDSFGCVSNSSFDYKSIHVKADFTVDPEKGEAPLEVSFTDKSVRGSKYLWEFGDDSTSTISSPPPHIYYIPGFYKVKLTIESELHCIDSLTYEKEIEVEKSQLDIPNVFTPDGDGLNDYFVVESKSLRFLTVEVFSRSGLRVYYFNGSGEKLRDWTGWDGNINNSSRPATPGVYFYIIRAYGWDDVKYDDKKKHRGFVYLYR